MAVLSARAAVQSGGNHLYSTARLGLCGCATIAALSAAGCSAAPPLPQAAAAADASITVPAVRYSSVTAPYMRQRPLEPLPWLEQNRRVTPQGVQ